MRTTKKAAFILLLLVSFINVEAQKIVDRSDIARLKWIDGEKPPNPDDTYTFEVVKNIEANTLFDADENAVNKLIANLISSQSNLSVTAEMIKEIHTVQNGADYDETEKNSHIYTIKGKTFEVRYKLLDSYWEKYRNGTYMYFALYAVARNPDDFEVEPIEYTTNYGSSAVWRGVFPGWSQLHKGQKKKGAYMLATTGLFVTALTITQVNFAKNYDKAIENRGIRSNNYLIYKANYEDWYKARTFVGIGFGLYYVLSFIDIFATKGVKHYAFQQKGLSINPNFNANYYSLSLKFNF